MVLPGFHDSHAHPMFGGVELARRDLSGQTTVDAIIATITACNQSSPGSGWLLGSGWDLSLFPRANPSK
jgi:predicted amidohydrolase YtcJ